MRRWFFSKYIFQYLAFIGYIQRIKYMEQTDRRAIQRLKRDNDKKENKLDFTPRFTSIEIIDATEDNLLKNPKG